LHGTSPLSNRVLTSHKSHKMSDSDDSEWGSSDDDDNAPPSMMFCDEENNYMSVHDVEMGGVLELKLVEQPQRDADGRAGAENTVPSARSSARSARGPITDSTTRVVKRAPGRVRTHGKAVASAPAPAAQPPARASARAAAKVGAHPAAAFQPGDEQAAHSSIFDSRAQWEGEVDSDSEDEGMVARDPPPAVPLAEDPLAHETVLRRTMPRAGPAVPGPERLARREARSSSAGKLRREGGAGCANAFEASQTRMAQLQMKLNPNARLSKKLLDVEVENLNLNTMRSLSQTTGGSSKQQHRCTGGDRQHARQHVALPARAATAVLPRTVHGGRASPTCHTSHTRRHVPNHNTPAAATGGQPRCAKTAPAAIGGAARVRYSTTRNVLQDARLEVSVSFR
jgi:hypothetical protein